MLLQRRDVGLLTFGEPRVGNVFFAEFVRAWVPAAVRAVHQDDAVPHLPPQGNELLLLTAFHHHGTEQCGRLGRPGGPSPRTTPSSHAMGPGPGRVRTPATMLRLAPPVGPQRGGAPRSGDRRARTRERIMRPGVSQP